MNDYKNFEGSSLEEALKKATVDFGVDIDKIEYTLIEEQKHFLGIGNKVIIDAKIKETEIEETISEEIFQEAIEEKSVVEEIPVVEPESVSITKEEGEVELKPELLEEESNEDVFFNVAKEFIENTIQKMGINASLIIDTVNEDVISFNVVGEDIAILIGKYGATLDALQYLACIIANKKFPCRRRIVIDADGHRAKRTKELQARALKIADMVVKHGREAVMEPQNAKDRRIVHMALRNHEGVKTYSEGEGTERHVIISPKDN